MKIKKLEELSLFLPAYNEEAVIEETILKVNPVLKKVAKKYEILIVNDGSRDRTGQIVKSLMKKIPQLRLVTHDPNRGYGGALRTGFSKTRFDPVVFTDSDGQFDFAEVSKLIEKYQTQKTDLVIGYRIKRDDPPLRLMIARLLKYWNLFWFGMWVRDTDCAFKLISRHVLDEVGPTLKSNGGSISTEFLAKAIHHGFRYAEVGVHHYPRVAGKSTGGNVSVISKAVKETFQIWLDLNTSA